MILERNILQKEASKTGDQILFEEFKIKAKEVKKAVRQDKKHGQQGDLGHSAGSRLAWKSAKNILGMRNTLSPTAIIDTDGTLTTNPTKLSNMFNAFFVEKIKKLRTKTNISPKLLPVTRLKNWIDCRDNPLPEFILKPLTRYKLRKHIKQMKGGRSAGVDTIDSFSLKIAAPLLEDALEHLINLSIQSSRFSSQWKPQLIFPQYKKNDKNSLENYRPVSHLVEIGKLVEREVNDQVVAHFTAHGLFHRNHHGGIPHHSTDTALIQLHDMFLQAAKAKKLTAALLLDQSAAYDLLDHTILLDKLNVYKFDQKTIDWFNSYLCDRSQLVQIETKQSSQIRLGDYAAPQGSVLGGTLFVIYENDFPAVRANGQSVMFVDDDTDCVSNEDPTQLLQVIQGEANLSCDWLTDNRMCVAGQKSKLMIIGTKSLKQNRLQGQEVSILVDGQEIKNTPSEKLLGVVINENMTWKEHLHGEQWRTNNNMGLISQLSQRVGLLRRISNIASKQKLKMIADGLFYSKLSYCLPLFVNIWGLETYSDTEARFTCYTKEDNRKLQVLQNQVARILINKPLDRHMPTKDLLNLSGDLSIH